MIKAVRGEKVRPITPERQQRVNEARRKRIAAGKRDKTYSLRKRIVGFA